MSSVTRPLSVFLAIWAHSLQVKVVYVYFLVKQRLVLATISVLRGVSPSFLMPCFYVDAHEAFGFNIESISIFSLYDHDYDDGISRKWVLMVQVRVDDRVFYFIF